MKNYTKISVGQDARTELHDQLGLTGAEISVNNLPAGAGVPFVHYHHKNEEIYMILSGRGQAVLDGETVALNAGDWLRIAPETRRQFSAPRRRIPRSATSASRSGRIPWKSTRLPTRRSSSNRRRVAHGSSGHIANPHIAGDFCLPEYSGNEG